ncbi:MAG TPA: enoyl-CoA hydratase-related protein [Chitinophagales bacterium]|nr:enoyl-CoA hydratase-related protein [Chitinophagales bacterium]
MDPSLIRIEKQDRIAFITLCRSEKKNALNDALVKELTSAFSSLESDNNVKVIVLKAEGDVFSAGADLDYLQRLQNFSFEENLADSNSLKELLLKIYCNKKVVIAQVEGHAIAGGCGLATVCDFCFAVPEAKFGYTEVKIGFIPALVSVFLARKISGADARELLLTGNLISASRAEEIGLINSIIEKNKIAGWVKQFATDLCNETSSQSIAATKELLSKISSPELNEALDIAARMNAHARASADCKKGIDSFLKKEKIKW